MKRILIISGLTLAALIVLGSVTLLGLLYTNAGRNVIIAQVESELANALGGSAEIASLDAAMPGKFVFRGVELKDKSGRWATIEQVDLDLRLLKLLQKKIDVQKLHFTSVHLLREPPQRPPKEKDTPQQFSLKLPSDLPNIAVDDLRIINFQSDLGAELLRIDGAGALDMGGRKILAAVNLASEKNLDQIDIAIDLQPSADLFDLNVSIKADEGGFISALSQIGGPLRLNMEGGGPFNAAQIVIDGVVGDYGSITAEMSGNLKKIVTADLAGEFTPGSALVDVEELSLPIAFNLRINERGKGGVITIDRLTSAIGGINGTVAWKNERTALNNFSLDLQTSFTESYRPRLQQYIGTQATLSADIERQRREFSVTGNFAGDGVSLSIVDGTTDLRDWFTGEAQARIVNTGAFALLPSSADLAGRLDLDLDDKADVQSLTITLDDGSSLGGAGFYSFVDKSINFIGDVDASPALISSFLKSAAPTGAMAAEIELSGAIEQFTLKVTAQTPAINIGENQAPALAVNAALAGLPFLPTGEISARALGGEGRLNAVLRSSEDGRVSVNELQYLGAGFALSGSGAYAPRTQAIKLALTYNGENGAEPWPGLMLAGDAHIEGVLARSGEETDFTIKSEKLNTESMSLSGLTMTASGPPGEINLAAAARNLATPQTGSIENLSTKAVLDMRRALTITLTALNGSAADTLFSLRTPGRITIKNGVEVDNFRLNWGSAGFIALDGAFSSTRWRADAKLTDVVMPGADGGASADIYLNTDEPIPARGAVALQSLLVENLSDAVKASFVWTGDALTVNSAADEESLDMSISLPVTLTRTPELAVTTKGALDGYLRYDGPINMIAAYLPPGLQTLEGALAADFRLGGSTVSPEVSGRAEITGGAYTEVQTGLSVAGLHVLANASYSGAGSTINFTGGARGANQSDGDTITLDGAITLDDNSRLDLNVQFDDAELSAHPVNNVRANGQVEIAGPLNAISAKGAISIEELNAEIVTPENTGLAPIEVVTIEDQELQAGAVEEMAQPASVDIDVKFEADDRIFIRGRGLESEWSATISAVTEKQKVMVLGAMTLRRGWIDFSGRRFALTQGNITFDKLSANNPLLDIRAEYETSDGVTAIIAVTGRAKEPDISLTANPSLPSSDIMALVLFGKPADELSALESLQAAQALASLGGIGPFGGAGVTGSLRQAARLDLLNFDLDPEKGGGSLTVGKYVADGLFVSATQDAQGEEGSVRVEYEITGNITVETEVKQNGDQTVSANWKQDF